MNVPFNPYHLSVTAAGFAAFTGDVDVRSAVPVTLEVRLKLATSATSITVEAGGGLIETEPAAHTDVDTGLIEKLPLESQSSSVSSLVTLASPGVVADSNGLFHGLGDHAKNSFSVDGANPSPASGRSWRALDRVHEPEGPGGRSRYFAAPASEYRTAKGL